MKHMLVTYTIAGILWDAYASRKTVTEFGDEGSPKTAFVINAIIWPIGMIIATVKESKDV